MRPLLSLAVLASTLLAGPVAGQDAPRKDAPKKDRDVILHEELAAADSKFPDLFQAVRSLRPQFLSENRGVKTMGIQPGGGAAQMCNETLERNCSARKIVQRSVPPVVYLDGMKLGDPDVLKGMRTGEVEEVRYLTASKASMEFGLGHDGGAILVKMHRGTKP
jgi:hypothetical protein